MPAEVKQKVTKRSDEKGDKQPSFLERSKRFLTDVRTEMRKVTTPSTKEVRATTGVVIVTVFLFAAYFYVVDKGVGAVIDAVLKMAKG
jgi:preprotein translocase subunit SecE